VFLVSQPHSARRTSGILISYVDVYGAGKTRPYVELRDCI
jgi:hypothetical protein